MIHWKQKRGLVQGGKHRKNRLYTNRSKIQELYPVNICSGKIEGSLEQQRQIAAIKLERRIHFKHNFAQQKPRETGDETQYNIQHARKQPGLLEKHTNGAQINIKYNPGNNNSKLGNAKNIIHETQQQAYSVIQQHHKRQIWDKKGYGHATEDEKQEYIQPKQERAAIHSELSTLCKSIARMGKKHKLTKNALRRENSYVFFTKREMGHPIC